VGVLQSAGTGARACRLGHNGGSRAGWWAFAGTFISKAIILCLLQVKLNFDPPPAEIGKRGPGLGHAAAAVPIPDNGSSSEIELVPRAVAHQAIGLYEFAPREDARPSTPAQAPTWRNFGLLRRHRLLRNVVHGKTIVPTIGGGSHRVGRSPVAQALQMGGLA
jgi:hypothetical protein